MQKSSRNRRSERGGAGVNALLVVLALIVVANAGYQFIPVAYEAEGFKQEMQTAVVQGIAVPVQGMAPPDAVKKRLIRSAPAYHIPSDAAFDVKMTNGALSARVVYSKQVPVLPFGLYFYQYHFDHTATPTGFLTRD